MLFIAVGFFLVFWTPVFLIAGPYLVPFVGPFEFICADFHFNENTHRFI
ncbi:hypothetical protein C497_02557 [Halalkalicoccus jeotgali B3]|uniref:Uncharacterized protein n=1 Tax=Halalkalicoccus jeotgali (strain DSM 18796 / CECT 7217 / JCM 14584 / KCTC 4019 / B3) TaxID=795797 RepID=D8JBY7_HALJB|nr:hypothetical protein HacjB3_17236 [Halalkalicoccus jeotgali B3]ELY40924.1 hypothetical protein C497_02557 [Halalkalicoccus jeotgali B3]